MKYIKKYGFIILIIITLLRFFLSYNLPSFFLSNLEYDDYLMVSQSNYLLNGDYLGTYLPNTLIKGIVFPILLTYSKITGISYSIFFTVMYILACIFFIYSLSSIIKNKKVLAIMYVVILFNPVTYSCELFQRLYRNTISITELLFFLGMVFKIISSKKNIINYLLIGLIASIMLLTREDNIWVTIVLILLIIYKLYKNKDIKSILLGLIPFVVIIVNLNIVSTINYNHYGIYTYNEIKKSNFKNTYKKILQIKDDEKKDKVSIPKSTLYKLVDNCKSINITKEDVDNLYADFGRDNTSGYLDGEIDNSAMIWTLRILLYQKNKFRNGQESEEYFKKLGEEIDEAFKDGRLEKELIIPSILIATPTANEIKEYPVNIIKAIIYTSSYDGVKTIDSISNYSYSKINKSYRVFYKDFRNVSNMVEKNSILYETLIIIYRYFTIILSIVSVIIYVLNIKKKDKINLINHILVIIYLAIICGVSYTHTTSFPAIRYCYLGNVYIIQNVFIVLNIYRFYKKKKKR